jgi:catechol 2,3-dioxygenase-like lactoylglutathione lyase family enzyme
MYKALFLSPMIPSYDLAETGRFFKDILGFTSVMDTPGYGIYQKDNLTVHLLPAGQDIGQMECYLEINDVDGLWASIGEKLTAQGIRVREPFDREYGMREMHIAIPKTNALLFVGQEIRK